MKTKLITTFYSVGLIHHLYTCYYSRHEVDFSKTTKQEVLDVQLFSNRFLTSWNMGLQTIYFMLALTFEILLYNKHQITPNVIENLNKVRGFLFSTLVLPSTAIVALFFWFIYHLDKDFVIPNGIEEVFPDWINHSIHTNIIFLPIVELYLQNLYIPSFWMSLIGLTIYSHFYNVIYLFTYFETGKWMYPIFNLLTWPQRILLMEVMFVTGIIACFIGHFIQRMKTDKCDITKANLKTRALNIVKKLL